MNTKENQKNGATINLLECMPKLIGFLEGENNTQNDLVSLAMIVLTLEKITDVDVSLIAHSIEEVAEQLREVEPFKSMPKFSVFDGEVDLTEIFKGFRNVK